MKKATRLWVRKAEADRRGADGLLRAEPRLHDLICFHWQQCAEKYLKALLLELGLSVPKTHDLDHLWSLTAPHHAALQPLRRGLLYLSAFAVETRYPGENATKRQAAAAIRIGRRTREAARMILGLRNS